MKFLIHFYPIKTTNKTNFFMCVFSKKYNFFLQNKHKCLECSGTKKYAKYSVFFKGIRYTESFFLSASSISGLSCFKIYNFILEKIA